MFDWLINFIQEHFLNKNFKNSRMITPGSYYSFKKTKTKNQKKQELARNGKPKLILRMFVNPQNYIPAEKSRWTKYCKRL